MLAMAPYSVSALLATFMTEAWKQDHDAEHGHLQCYNALAQKEPVIWSQQIIVHGFGL